MGPIVQGSHKIYIVTVDYFECDWGPLLVGGME